jgi:hypothetical protein
VKNEQQPEAPGPALHLRPAENGRWTWSYSEPATDVTLYSNETFSTREAAMDWAQRAYPEIPFAEEED